MPSPVSIELRGLRQAQDKTIQVMRDLQGAPMVEAMRTATLLALGTAKRLTPVDTGRLRASITPEVRMAGSDVVGSIGSNLAYAPHVELGTKPHFPPPGALQVWARRHGVNAYALARAISRRGTKAHHMLEEGVLQNAGRIGQLLDNAVGRIVEQ